MKKRLYLWTALLLLLLGPALGVHLWAYSHYWAAERALARRAFPEAQEHLAQCLQVWRWGAQTHLLVARIARRDKAFVEAEQHLQKSRELGGPEESIRLEYLLLRAQQGDFARVERQLVSRVVQDHPDTVLILEVLVPLYMSTYQLANAQECVRRWLQRAPDQLEAWLWQAKLSERSNNHEETLSAYRRLVELDPDNDDARLQFAGLLSHGHQPREALAQFEYLRARYGDTLPILLGLVRCRRALNEPEEARRLLDQVLAENPRSWMALGERGRLALAQGDAAEAESWFRKAVAVMPYEEDVHYGLYQCLVRLGKKEEAAQVQARMRSLNADLGRLADVTRAIGAAPHDAGLRYEAGLILMRNGKESEGIRWLESALQEDPRHAATHRALAEYYERNGDKERAEQHRQLALGSGK
ncbi:MAG: tetratricopeptide repeat protein [Gemmataceae bacterium]|nr:tetratricopeptide repeat protein [Gemmataceae bacterium]